LLEIANKAAPSIFLSIPTNRKVIEYSVKQLAGYRFQGIGLFGFSKAALGIACTCSGLALPVPVPPRIGYSFYVIYIWNYTDPGCL
jgi:hypothetical protein